MHYTFPETLVEGPTDGSGPNGMAQVSIDLRDDVPDGEEVPVSSEATSIDMLKSIVKEGLPRHCPPKSDTLFGGKNLMGVPIPGRDGDILGILVVGDKEERGGSIAPFTDEDVILLDSFAKQAGVAIENAHLHQEALEARSYKRKWRRRARYRRISFQRDSPTSPDTKLPGIMNHAVPLVATIMIVSALPTGHWGLAIADVSGKGMQAALLMATLRAGLISELVSWTGHHSGRLRETR